MCIRRGTLITALATAVVGIVLLAPAMAGAQEGPADVQYNPADQTVTNPAVGGVGGAGGGGGGGDGDEGGVAGVTDTSGGGLSEPVVSSLPFSGFDLLALALGALAITGTGFMLRRLSRPPQTPH